MRLVILGDSCSGVPGGPNAAAFRQVAQAVIRHAAGADALCYLGDHVDGYADPVTMRQQWAYFLEQEFAPLAAAFRPVFHLPSNHTVHDPASAAIFGELLLDGGVPGLVLRRGLNHAVTLKGAALIFLNTADPDNRGNAMLDLAFLREALSLLPDARPKLVFGHHPIAPVNGYRRFPLWRVAPETGMQALAAMRDAGVTAYICSHVIAYDVQMLGGLLQICTAGGGTAYGPGGAMPGTVEHPHLVVLDLERDRLALRKYDADNALDEWLDWPLPETAAADTRLIAGEPVRIDPPPGWGQAAGPAFWLHWQIAGRLPARISEGLPLLYAWRGDEGPAILRIDIGADRHPALRLVPLPCEGDRLWRAPFALEEDFALEMAVHTGAGPGGILIRQKDGPWHSLTSTSARGAEQMDWPPFWCAGIDPDVCLAAPAAMPRVEMRMTALPAPVSPGR